MKDPETMGILKNLKLLSPWTHDYVEYEWPLVIPVCSQFPVLHIDGNNFDL